MSITVRLTDPAAVLPLPGMVGVFAPAAPFQVNPLDPFWGQCLADGTVTRVPDTEIAAAPAPRKPADK